MTTQLSPHFSLEELIASEKARELGIDNTPSAAVLVNLRRTAQQMEIVRDILGNLPIVVSSGYRCPRLNVAVGGAKTSAHVLGYAVDFTCPQFGSPVAIALALEPHVDELRADQIIFEMGRWVHISFAPAERREILTTHDGVTYLYGIHEAFA